MRFARASLSLALAAPLFAAISVPLTVQEAIYSGGTTGVARANEPLTVGVPLPDAANITSTGVLGLTGASAAQFVVTGTWPSGNIKWLKVRAIVPIVSAGSTATITLTDSGAGSFGGSNLATDNGTTITVATGAATFTVKKANFNVFDVVSIGATSIITTGQSQGIVVLGPDPTATYPGNVTCSPTSGGSACTTVYASSNDASSTCSVEENGPAAAILKCSGSLIDGSSHAYLKHVTRMTFWKNRSSAEIVVSRRNADHGSGNTFATAAKGFQGFEIRIKTVLSGTLTYNIANHTATPDTGTLNAAGGTDSAYLYQAKSNLMKYSTCDGSSVTGGMCVDRSSISGYAVMTNGSSVRTGTASQYPAGWADIQDSSGVGALVGQYQLAAYENKSLEFRAGGPDVRIGLDAAENNTTGVTTTTANKPYYHMWPTNALEYAYVQFHASALSTTTANNAFLSYQHPLLARASVAHYNTAGVFPYPLLDPTEETAYYSALAASALPSPLTAPSNVDASVTAGTLVAWRFWAWETGGGNNQMDFSLAKLYNFLRRGFTGAYLDAIHRYRMDVQGTYPASDGFDWRSFPSELDTSTFPTQTVANSNLSGYDWETKYEHPHSYGIFDAYYLSGDEFIKEGILDQWKEHWLNGAGNVVVGGSLWNARAVGNSMTMLSRLYDFLRTVGDSEYATALTRATTVYTNQVRPSLCNAGWQAGATCSIDPQNHGGVGAPGHGISRERGTHYEWAEAIGVNAGCGFGVSTAPNAGPFQTSMYLQGIWELRRAQGSSWQYYNESFDLAYGVANWAIKEMYSDDGTGRYGVNGFRHYQMIDYANACNDPGSWTVTAEQTVWYPFFILHQYDGSTNWKTKFDMVLQRDISVTATDEFYGNTIANVVYLLNHPVGTTLQAVPITGFTDNGGGSYTISWAPPAGAQRYRIKYGPKQIVDWIGFDASTQTFAGSPSTTQNWFASTDYAGTPNPTSTTIATGQTGLTSANFAIKATVAVVAGSPTSATKGVVTSKGSAVIK